MEELTKSMKYRKGYKYQLADDYTIQIDTKPPEEIETQFISLSVDGLLTIKDGYAWDGPSGPTIDTPNFMTPSLVHDAIYQLMRYNLIPRSWRYYADKLLVLMCKNRKMWKVRRWWVYSGVRRFASFAANPDNKKEVIEVK